MRLRGTPAFPPPRRILVVQPRRIGDVLLGTPALRALTEQFPQAPLDFLVEPPCDEALWGNPRIARLLVAPTTRGFRENLAFIRTLRAERYDWTIDFFSNPRSAQFSLLSGAKVRVGLNRRGRRWAYTHHVVEEEIDRNRYAVDWRLEILRLMGVKPAGFGLEVYADRMDDVEAARATAVLERVDTTRPIVAVSTGSANTEKLYPPDLTGRMIEGLLKAGFSVVVTSGPGETKLAAEALAALSRPVPHLVGARVPTLAALYRRVQLFVGVDSGPKHVAAACGLPMVTIFGLGRPQNWNDPTDTRARVIRPPGIPETCDHETFVRLGYMQKIPPGEIVAAAVELIKP